MFLFFSVSVLYENQKQNFIKCKREPVDIRPSNAFQRISIESNKLTCKGIFCPVSFLPFYILYLNVTISTLVHIRTIVFLFSSKNTFTLEHVKSHEDETLG